MEVHGRATNSATPPSEEEMELRRGPWTVEEDLVLVNYISSHGEGRWNSLARMAGLRRTGKSCRLRWLNYLRPGVRRGNFTPEEQLLILELHSRWGNRWSKIAQQLPGRTDNEIKNYWRTRVQKHAKQLHCDANSKQFQDVIRYSWMPRLLERIKLPASSSSSSSASAAAAPSQTPTMDRVETDVELPDGLNPGAHSEPMMLVGCAQGSENRGDDDDGVRRWFDSSLSPNNQRGYPGSVEFDHGWWGAENFWSVDDSWFLQH